MTTASLPPPIRASYTKRGWPLDREFREDVDDQTIRRNSNVLWTLLIDGWYGRAWRAAGNRGQPSVDATDLAAALAGRDLTRMEYAQAGGGISHGMGVAGTMEYSRVLTPDERRASHERVRDAMESGRAPHERRYLLSEYLDSPSVVARGRLISRRLVVKYMGNRLGGRHLGSSEHKDNEVFDFLDEVADLRQIAGRPAMFFEALSIGQTIGQSDDARALRAKLNVGS